MTIWDQSICWLLSRILEEASLGNLWFLTVAEHKPLGRKADDQGSKESYTLDFILFVQGWLTNFPKIIVKNWRAQVQNFGNTLTYLIFQLSFQLCCWQKNKGKKGDCISHPCIGVNFSPTIYFKLWVTATQAQLTFLWQRKEKMNAREFKISLHLSFGSS